MKLQAVLILGLFGLTGVASAQEVLCPSSGLPVSQDPGCWAREHETAAQQQQASQQFSQPPQPTGYWEKTWGAIAPSPKEAALGVSVGASSKEEAERLALEDCKTKGGGECAINLAYYNQCAVMIVGEKSMNSFGGATLEGATSRGLKSCRKENTDCRVYYSACTEPIFHRY